MKAIKRVNSIHLNVSRKQVWEILTESKWTQMYMYNCEVVSNFKKGSSIEWKGEFQGQMAHLTGIVLEIEPLRLLKYSGIDPQFGDVNKPTDYFHVTYELREQAGGILLTVINEIFDGNEERIEHIVAGWENMVFPKIESILNERVES